VTPTTFGRANARFAAEIRVDGSASWNGIFTYFHPTQRPRPRHPGSLASTKANLAFQVTKVLPAGSYQPEAPCKEASLEASVGSESRRAQQRRSPRQNQNQRRRTRQRWRTPD